MNFFKTRHLSKDSLLKFRCMMEFIINSKKLTLKPLSSRENISHYNRLNKEVADFKECKGGLVMLHNTKCFHHQDGEDADNDKRYKIHTQHQRQIKHCRTIACLRAYTQYKKMVGAQLKQQL